jgi:hypothetical protein
MTLYVIEHDGRGMGGLLAPPGHWDLEYTLAGYYNGRRKRDADSLSSIGHALDDPDANDAIKSRVREIMASAVLVCSELWLRSVYGYFRHCYAPEEGNRKAADALIDPSSGIAATRHLGYMAVREYFPDHEPRTDLIRDPGKGYGSWPCLHCDQRVQYEARTDALTVYGTANGQVCPVNGTHITEEK